MSDRRSDLGAVAWGIVESDGAFSSVERDGGPDDQPAPDDRHI